MSAKTSFSEHVRKTAVLNRLRILILGSAAGGGLPQWNCGCPNCDKARRGDIPSRSQSSIAVSGDNEAWAIVNASPDIRTQLAASPSLHPNGPRTSPITSVLLTNGDIDHIAGLLTLREQQSFTLYCTTEIASVIQQNRIFDALNPELVMWRTMALDETVEIAPGVTAEMFAVPGKVPLFLEQGDVQTDLEGGHTVGVRLASAGATAFYIPGCARMTDALANRLRGAELVLFDGTVWEDNEMISAGVGWKTGSRMGHIAMQGPGGSLKAFDNLDVSRKVYVHMNNTNPVLDPQTSERRAVEDAGWIVAEDGMELTL
jgi:pyrroloquinoline quinone biosynthesis protein B